MITVDNFNLINNRDEIIVSDYDGVMQLIEFPWIDSLIKNKEIFEPYFDYSKIEDEENLINNFIDRDKYYLNDWLVKDNVDKSSNDYKEICNLFMRLYIEDENLYKKMPFTNMANAYGYLLKKKFVKKIIFLSHCPHPMTEDVRKEDRIKDFIELFDLPSDKVEYYSLPINKSKAEWIKENVPNYTTFIDDRIDIVQEVIEKTDSENKTFLIPRFGYSRIEEYKELCELGEIGRIVNNYSNFI